MELKVLIPTKLTQKVVGKEVRVWLNNISAVLILKEKKKWANKCVIFHLTFYTHLSEINSSFP